MGFCMYQNILGKPNIGFHNHFGFGFAILDFLAIIAIAFLITIKTKYKSFPLVLGGLMISGIILHKIFCVDTVLNKIILGN